MHRAGTDLLMRMHGRLSGKGQTLANHIFPSSHFTNGGTPRSLNCVHSPGRNPMFNEDGTCGIPLPLDEFGVDFVRKEYFELN